MVLRLIANEVRGSFDYLIGLGRKVGRQEERTRLPVFKEGKRASSPTKLLTDSLTYMFPAPWYRPPPSCEHNPQPSVTESMG